MMSATLPKAVRNVRLAHMLHLRKHQEHNLKIASLALKVNSEINIKQYFVVMVTVNTSPKIRNLPPTLFNRKYAVVV